MRTIIVNNDDIKDVLIATLQEELAHLRGNMEAMRDAYGRLKERLDKQAAMLDKETWT